MDDENYKHVIFMRNHIKPFLNELNKYISMYFEIITYSMCMFKYTQD